jgi:hypothetical protein
MSEKELASKPKVSNSASQKELDRAEKQFDRFQEEVSSLTLDRMNQAPPQDREQQTKLSSKELSKKEALYLKPVRAIGSKEKFNEAHRSDYEHAMERVEFVAENYEIIGEDIELWTKPFPGMDAEWWKVPTNRAVNGPRHLAERIKGCVYHRLEMKEGRVNASDSMGTYYGTMVADSTRQRLDAFPTNTKKSVFMGASGF